MELTCPACGKKISSELNCPRCGCEINNLHEIANASVNIYDDSCDLLRKGLTHDALKSAEKSWELVHSEKAAAVAFVASLSHLDSDVTLAWWSRAQSIDIN
jgi:uncharacterized membrane protein YvbJ